MIPRRVWCTLISAPFLDTRRRAPLAALACALTLHAASPTAWEMNTYDDFLKGRMTGLSLQQDGRLTLAPKLDTLFAPEEPAIWSVVPMPDGSFVIGTGHRGRVYRVRPDGTNDVLFTSPEPEVFAVAAVPNGVVYAATSPNGKVYRIENGKAAEYFSPGAAYIWSLAVAADGTLFVGTGNDGKIFHVTAQAQAELYYETGQSHVTTLAFDKQHHLLAGTEPNGIIYRIEAKDRAFVLYDAGLPEIRSLAVADDGAIYAAAMGGALARQPGAQGATPTTSYSAAAGATSHISITVTDQSAQAPPAQAGPDVKSVTQQQQPAAPAAATSITPATLVEYPGVEKSAIYKILPDNTVETLWSSKDENVYDLADPASGLVFSTDEDGRLYRLDENRRVTLLAATTESEALRVVPARGSLVVATGNQGKLLRLGDARTETGEFESPVHDASTVARWGRLSWQQSACTGCSVAFRTRSGNSARPDKTWSDWSEPLTEAAGSAIPSPNARYVQWKAELHGTAAASPEVDGVRLAYLPQNTSPVVKSISVNSLVSPNQAKPAGTTTPASASYSITVTDNGDPGASTLSGTATQPVTRAANEQLLVSWQAEDPDGDRLLYTVQFRGEQERDWKTLKNRVTDSNLTLDSEALADGRYLFRVVASDALMNTPAQAREAELISAPILVDRTPPTVTITSRTIDGGVVELTAVAQDSASPLVRCEYSVNAGPWLPVPSEDGIVDSPTERFILHVEPGSGRERSIVIRAYDSANNAGLGKIVLQ